MSSALTKILVVIVETINEVGEVPDGHLYVLLQSALGTQRWSFDVHTAVIGELVASGKLVKNNHVLTVSDEVKKLLAKS